MSNGILCNMSNRLLDHCIININSRGAIWCAVTLRKCLEPLKQNVLVLCPSSVNSTVLNAFTMTRDRTERCLPYHTMWLGYF